MKDIAQVVSSYIPLKEELRANCPFHEDSKRSFHVDVSTQKFRCLECSADGSVVDFVCRYENASQEDSFRRLI
jgi:DNA primase